MQSSQVFKTLLKSAKDALKSAQQSGAQAFEKGDTGRARQAADRVEKLQALIKSIHDLQQEWNMLIPQPSRSPGLFDEVDRKERAPSGTRTHQSAYRLPILQALVDLGGRLTSAKALDHVGELLAGTLNVYDYETLKNKKELRWRNAAAWERHEMVKLGLLRSDSPVGIWEITDEGRAYLAEHQR